MKIKMDMYLITHLQRTKKEWMRKVIMGTGKALLKILAIYN